MTTTTYRIAPAPKFAGMRDWTCARCGREEVRPVFLTGPDGTASYGSGCAALLLGRPGAGRRVVVEADAVQRAEDERLAAIVERQARYAAALLDFETDPNRSTGALDSCRRTYHVTGGASVHGSFPAWLALVAETGEL